ncbi:MAG: hypothetical protein A3I66_02315 [Burkholderiales bacterium RIFCSPLOWO2_02_FULL_57_36]|nr:MAG: hypothetical protein A3I66_02315 [Burkholderiales bacterium RIFCSPLOWO2_02_FULL_57_36]
MKAFDNFFWHDGNLIDVKFSIDKKGRSSLQITALFYESEDASDRRMYQITAGEALRFSCSLDAAQLKENAFAGNIWNGYLKENVLWMYCTDGVIEVHAKKFKLEKC